MPKGSMVIWMGQTFHGVGANESDGRRIGMNIDCASALASYSAGAATSRLTVGRWGLGQTTCLSCDKRRTNTSHAPHISLGRCQTISGR